jgi:hypothetical protein
MSPKEVIGKFVSFELIIKDYKHTVNLEQGATSTPEVQPVAFKATEEKKEESTSTRLPIDASNLDNEELALIIKSFRQILKQKGGKTTSPAPKGCATSVVSPVTLSLNVHILVKVTGTKTRRGRRRRRRDTTRIRAARRTWGGNGTLMRALPTRMPPTSPSTRASSYPMSATSVSWIKTAKRRRYTLEPHPNILHLVIRVALVKMKMI